MIFDDAVGVRENSRKHEDRNRSVEQRKDIILAQTG